LSRAKKRQEKMGKIKIFTHKTPAIKQSKGGAKKQ
jgi:hypothetical protein